MRLDLHHLGLLSAGQRVDLLDLRLGDLLQAGVGALRVVLGHLALLLHLVDPVQLVAPDVADRDPRLLRLLPDELDEVAAALLGQRRDRHADHGAVARRVEALVPAPQSLLDGADLALVIDLDHEQPRFWRADLGQLVERCRRAVVRHHHLVDQRRVGAPGADGGEVDREVLDRLRHLRLGVAQDRIDHCAAPTPDATSVPISSPSTTRSMFPSSRRLNTMIGHVVVHAQRQRGVVHHLDAAIQHLEVAQLLELGRAWGPASDRPCRRRRPWSP